MEFVKTEFGYILDFTKWQMKKEENNCFFKGVKKESSMLIKKSVVGNGFVCTIDFNLADDL